MYYPVLIEIKIFKTVAFVHLTLLKLYLICELPCSVCRCRRFFWDPTPTFWTYEKLKLATDPARCEFYYDSNSNFIRGWKDRTDSSFKDPDLTKLKRSGSPLIRIRIPNNDISPSCIHFFHVALQTSGSFINAATRLRTATTCGLFSPNCQIRTTKVPEKCGSVDFWQLAQETISRDWQPGHWSSEHEPIASVFPQCATIENQIRIWVIEKFAESMIPLLHLWIQFRYFKDLSFKTADF
jgi:hypothetical protein